MWLRDESYFPVSNTPGCEQRVVSYAWTLLGSRLPMAVQILSERFFLDVIDI